MVSALVVLPSIVPTWTEDCLRTWKGPTPMIVNNTTKNLGVAASWNIGVEMLLSRRLDYLILLSAAVRFGQPGGCDFLAALEERPRWGLEGGELGWHCVAFSRELFALVGRFDENFFAYWEDTDFSYRVQLATDTRGGGAWVKTPIRASLAGVAHGVIYGGAKVDMAAMEGYFTRKWGGPSGCESFDHPFGRPNRPLSWWPTGNDPALTYAEVRPGDRLVCPECRDTIIAGSGDCHGPVPLDRRYPHCGIDVPVKRMLKFGGPC